MIIHEFHQNFSIFDEIEIVWQVVLLIHPLTEASGSPLNILRNLGLRKEAL